MSLRISWLPLGHVAHGYRRVFAVHVGDSLRHVIVLSHMPYESVFKIKELVGDARVTDPALLWGLSAVVALLKEDSFVESDDGYLSLRPAIMTKEQLLPVESYLTAEDANQLVIP